MKHIINILDEACAEITTESLLNDEQKEELIDLISDIQNKIDDIYLENTGDSDEEY